ncbi:MAG: ATPase, partial [Dietzia sp.]|nr:ATPase [Dietzia sp.]
TDRPALVPPAPAAAETTTERQPTRVTALRLHRPTDTPEGSDDLPRRVRQASLAPQLRAQRPEEPTRPSGPQDDDGRTPELVRDRMAAYRDGWVRGGGRRPGRGATPAAAPRSDSSEGDPA